MNSLTFKRILILAAFLWSANLNAQYCSVSTTFPDDFLTNVSSVGATSNVNYNTSTYPTGSYSDQTSQVLVTHETQTFDINTTYNYFGDNGVNIWVDWGNDFVFDATDLIASLNNSSPTKTFTITVPVGTPLGTYRARVRAEYGFGSNPPACGNVSYGSTVDFTLSIVALPNCLAPSSLTVGNVVGTTLDLGWTENNTATQWQIEYGPHGFTQGTGTLALANSNPYLFTFTSGSDYDFYVRSICTPGDTSAWSSPYEYIYCTVSNSYGEFLTSVSSFGAVINASYSTNTAPMGSYANETAQSFIAYENLTFYMNTNYSSGTNTVNVWVDWNNDMTFGTNELVATATNSTMHSLPITIPAGTPQGDYRMRVRGQWGSGALPPCGNVNYGSTVDFTLTIAAPPTCLAPSNLTVSNVVGTTLDLGWTENNTATQWQIEYGAHGFTPGTGTFQLTNSNPYSFTFTPGNDYDFYVRSICAPGDTSYWSMAYEYTYCEVSTLYTGDHLSAVSSIGAETNVNYTTFSMPLGSYANETAQLFESYETQTFNMSTTYVGGGNGVNIWVDWNNDMVFDANELVGSLADNNATKNFTITVPVGTAQGDYRMRVRGQYGSTVSPPACGSVNYGSTVDFNLTIVAPPSCLAPSALNASNITSTSADLGWTENNNATTWNIEWGVAGFALGTGTPANGVTSNPYPIVITPNTDYQFYVQSDCGGGDISSWAGPFTFSNAYCAPTYSYSSEYLSVIETVGGIMDVSHTSASYPAGGYVDETAQILQVYETLTFDLNTVYTPTYGHTVRVWVDWNNDFNFDHSTEMVSTITGTGGLLTQQITVPAGTPVGTYRVRVRGVYGTGANPMPCSNESWGSAADFTLDVIAPPSCLPPMNISATNITTTSMELSWTELNAATSWNIEYGPSGYTQGSAAGIPVLANSNPFTVTGLSPSANYDFYVQSICSASDQSAWRGPYSQYTACGIAIAPFYEGFNSGVQPQCWDNLSSNPSTSVDNFWNFNKQGEYGALNNGKTIGTFVSSDGSTPNPDSMMLITPEIDISPLTTPYLSFEWFSNNTDNPGDNVPLIVEIFDGTTWHLLDTLIGDDPEWQFVNYNLSAFSNSIIKVRFMTNQSVPNTAFYNDILLDEVRIDDCISLGGQDGSFDICRFDNTVNLEDNIIVKPNGGGIWSFPSQPAYLVDDTVFNVQFLPAGSYEVYYVERFVCYDTTVATINVFGPSSAGIDGTIDVCKNAPINLYGVLGGNIDMGGVWYDFTNTALPNSQPKAQPIPGQYNYTYIVTNGVCPADTAIVEVGVLDTCDYLAIGEEEFTDISVYPNPTKNILNIVNPSNTSSLKIEMLDMNGRVVLVENKALTNASEATIAIEHLEKGIYTLRIYNTIGQKTFKIVKQ